MTFNYLLGYCCEAPVTWRAFGFGTGANILMAELHKERGRSHGGKTEEMRLIYIKTSKVPLLGHQLGPADLS